MVTFDGCPLHGATLEDLDLKLFNHHYLPKAIDEEILKNDTTTPRFRTRGSWFSVSNARIRDGSMV